MLLYSAGPGRAGGQTWVPLEPALLASSVGRHDVAPGGGREAERQGPAERWGWSVGHEKGEERKEQGSGLSGFYFILFF